MAPNSLPESLPSSEPEVAYPYGHKWRTVHRPESLKRAGGKFKGGVYIGGAACERCNQADLFLYGRTILEVAHLDGNSSNNAIKNRAALCHSCHRKIDYSSWKLK